MQATIDNVWETVRTAQEDGPAALAALALSYGASAVLLAQLNKAMRQRLIDLERDLDRAVDDQHAAKLGESAARKDYLKATARAESAEAQLAANSRAQRFERASLQTLEVGHDGAR